MWLRKALAALLLTAGLAVGAMDVKKGSFTAAAGSGTQDITSVGFQPKVYMLFTTNQTATGFASNQILSIGFTDGTTSRVASIFSNDGITTTDTSRSWGAEVVHEISGGLFARSAAHSAFLSNGFRLNWSTAGSSMLVHYTAWGGDDLTNVKVTGHTFSTGTGNRGYTGVGFKPDFLVLLSANHTALATDVAGLSISMGFGVSSSKRWAWSIFGRDAQAMEANQDNTRYQRTSAIFVSITNGAAEDSFLDLVSPFDPDGFTLNQVNAPAANLFMSIAFKGGSYDVGFDDKCVTTSCVDTITPTATPKMVLVTSYNGPAVSTVEINANVSIGAFDSTSEGNVWIGNVDATEPTEANRRYVTTTSLVTGVNPPSTVLDEADGAISGSTFTMTWNTNAGSVQQWLWASFGDTVLSAVGPRLTLLGVGR